MAEWKTYKLGEILDIVMGQSPQGEDCNNEGVGIPLLNGPSEFSFYHPCPIQWTTNSKKTSQKYDILFCVRGSTTGRMNWSDQEYSIGRGLAAIRHKKGIEYRYFAKALMDFYLLKILSSATGSTFPNVSKDILNNLLVSVPNLAVQKQIADILSSLDDKIEVNRKINENLEQQAEALFKSWFVDFEPFKDGKFIDSELGKIPEDLKLESIANIDHLLETGRRPKGGVKDIISGTPSIGAENIKGIGYYDFSKTKYVPAEFAENMKKGKINGYELLIYKDGGKPGYFIPNFSIFGEGFPFDNACINEHVFKLDFFDKGYNAFAYFFFQTDPIMSYLNAQGGKAAIPGINQKDIENIRIFTTDNDLVRSFCEKVQPIIRKILLNNKENKYLSQLRDTLLPKLMSGEISIL